MLAPGFLSPPPGLSPPPRPPRPPSRSSPSRPPRPPGPRRRSSRPSPRLSRRPRSPSRPGLAPASSLEPPLLASSPNAFCGRRRIQQAGRERRRGSGCGSWTHARALAEAAATPAAAAAAAASSSARSASSSRPAAPSQCSGRGAQRAPHQTSPHRPHLLKVFVPKVAALVHQLPGRVGRGVRARQGAASQHAMDGALPPPRLPASPPSLATRPLRQDRSRQVQSRALPGARGLPRFQAASACPSPACPSALPVTHPPGTGRCRRRGRRSGPAGWAGSLRVCGA